jgi:hypothetical protein
MSSLHDEYLEQQHEQLQEDTLQREYEENPKKMYELSVRREAYTDWLYVVKAHSEEDAKTRQANGEYVYICYCPDDIKYVGGHCTKIQYLGEDK